MKTSDVSIDPKERALLEAKAGVLKALAHPTRLYMAERLSAGEMCVCEFAEILDADVSTVSRHLSVLKAAHIVEAEKRGKQVFYSLKVPCVLNFMGCVEEVLKTSAEERSALVK